jgi:hypothetical protein
VVGDRMAMSNNTMSSIANLGNMYIVALVNTMVDIVVPIIADPGCIVVLRGPTMRLPGTSQSVGVPNIMVAIRPTGGSPRASFGNGWSAGAVVIRYNIVV